ncbi:MAG TPA: hypothetical protein VF066_02315 [Thermoleophilaceae bacterium]
MIARLLERAEASPASAIEELDATDRFGVLLARTAETAPAPSRIGTKALDLALTAATPRPRRPGLGEPRGRRAGNPVRERLWVYHELTEPVAGYYEQRGRLRCADGTRHQAEVQRELLTSLRRFAGTRTWRS